MLIDYMLYMEHFNVFDIVICLCMVFCILTAIISFFRIAYLKRVKRKKVPKIRKQSKRIEKYEFILRELSIWRETRAASAFLFQICFTFFILDDAFIMPGTVKAIILVFTSIYMLLSWDAQKID